MPFGPNFIQWNTDLKTNILRSKSFYLYNKLNKNNFQIQLYNCIELYLKLIQEL
jgi:hypothetical protein